MIPYCEYGNVLLKVENLSLSLGSKPILRDLNLEIRDIHRPGLTQGQVVGLLGPSGMGKTRLFRILAGLDEPDSGQVLIGEDQKPVHRGMVGVVAQQYPLFEYRTVMSNLLVAGRQAGLVGSTATDKAENLLKRFGLEGEGGKFPSQLSGGMRQRVAIAQQFMCSDHYLLMDEPFSGLDINAIHTVCEFISEVVATDEKHTFIVVTHDVAAALEVADTIWVLGRDRDESDKIIPGARIQQTYNLIERGLAWQSDVSNLPEFADVMREIRATFPRL